MAERQAGKAKKRAPKSAPVARTVPGNQPVATASLADAIPEPSALSASGHATPATTPSCEATIPAAAFRLLETERDALRAELEAAKSRIAELERSREQVLNRIDWVIDSLHNLIEE